MDQTPLLSSDSGFSLVEILISMLIFLIAATGIGYSLVQSDQQVITAEHILNSEQYGMTNSVTGGGQNIYTNLSGTMYTTTLPIALTLSPASPTQACSPGLLNGIGQFFGSIMSSISCFFGGCTTTPATQAPTSYAFPVPVTAFTTSDSQIAWWNP